MILFYTCKDQVTSVCSNNDRSKTFTTFDSGNARLPQCQDLLCSNMEKKKRESREGANVDQLPQ